MAGEANVYLIGMRGSGKTTLGRRLSARLRRPFVDTDARVRLETGKTVAELVAEGGWENFREAEALAFSIVAAFTGQVVACGGGIVLRKENRDLLKRGLTLFLEVDPEELVRRLARNPQAEQRPSLTGVSPLEEIRGVLAERGPIYHESACVVIRGDAGIDALTERALAEISRCEGREVPPPLRRQSSGPGGAR